MNLRFLLVSCVALPGALSLPFAGAACSSSPAASPPIDASPPDASSLARDASADAPATPDDAPATTTDASDGGAPDDAGTSDASCTGADLAARWASMDDAPVHPPNLYANLDLAGPTGTGLTLAEAQAIDCAGTIVVADDAGDWPAVVWGATGVDVSVGYDKTTLIAGYVILDKAPAFGFRSRDGAHSYAIALGQAVTKDGAAFPIDWTSQTTADPALTELDDAVRATFAPELPADRDCLALAPTQNCLVELDDEDGHSLLGFDGPDATGSLRLALDVAFAKGTNVAQFFLAHPVLPEADAGDGG